MTSPAAAPSSEQSEEDSSPASELSHAQRAKKLADEILHAPTTTDQAIELAKVYAILALTDALTKE
jgi:hypothetical protein